MPTIYFVADLHIGHANILKFTDRSFKSIEDMEAKYVAMINRQAKPEDTLVLLGDVCFGHRDVWVKFLDALNCKNLILVKGNHDKQVPVSKFRLIVDQFTFTVGKSKVTVSHYPMRTKWKLKYLFKKEPRYLRRMIKWHNGWHIHGHTHASEVLLHDGNQIHVGIDALGRLISLDEIRNLISNGGDNR